jgi:hypothetical protein
MWIGHGKRMIKAIGISAMVFQCHEDTWNEIRRLMQRAEAWSAPQVVPCTSRPLIEVQLSGPKAAAMLHEMRAQTFVRSGIDQALGRRVYIALAQIVDLVDPMSPGRPLPPVVLDNIADNGDVAAQ